MDHELDPTIPGSVYLCQGTTYACGACCGLYNVPDPSKAYLSSLLTVRTRRFRDLDRPLTLESLDRFRLETETAENQDRPYDEFHHCPYIGFIRFPEDPCEMERVGCLLHPLGDGNDGIDWRGLSDYGGMACRTYFCPTCDGLPARYKQLMRMAADDWYLYGLMTTETKMADAFFSQVEAQLGRELTPDACSAEGINAIRRFFRLKTEWPWRAPSDRRIGNYFFNDNLYPLPEPRLAEPISDRHLFTLIKTLRSVFTSAPDQDNAVKALEAAVRAVANGFIDSH
ncbi:MAG: hypothetical protein CSA22_08505 [Deltaproteobacteria bacterium]|nr:MAG: hypothetical protein CSA22_08505 [Deltaproteobacteria bacterium]